MNTKIQKFLSSLSIFLILFFNYSPIAIAAETTSESSTTGVTGPVGVTGAGVNGTVGATGAGVNGTVGTTGAGANGAGVNGPVGATGAGTNGNTGNPNAPKTESTPAPSASPAQAIISAANEKTGASSINNNATDIMNKVTENTKNIVKIANDIKNNANTGKNNLVNNSKIGDVKTGNILASTTVINVGKASVKAGSTAGTITLIPVGNNLVISPIVNRTPLVNNVTGNDSYNSNSGNLKNTVDIQHIDDFSTHNTLNYNFDTGDNKLTNNTSVNFLTTGNIQAGINVLNLTGQTQDVELSVNTYNVQGSYTGNIVLPDAALNTTTGAESSNQNNQSNQNTAKLTVINNTLNDNKLGVDANTGQNSITKTTSIGSTTTGDINVESNTANLTTPDDAIIYILNVYGEWDGQLEGVDPNRVIVNQITGEGSENNNSIINNSKTNTTLIDTVKNENDIVIHANTGRNAITGSTFIGGVKTGRIDLGVNTLNISAITNKLGIKSATVNIINVYGNLKGNITGKPVGNTEAPITQATNTSTTSNTGGQNISNNAGTGNGSNSVFAATKVKPITPDSPNSNSNSNNCPCLISGPPTPPSSNINNSDGLDLTNIGNINYTPFQNVSHYNYIEPKKYTLSPLNLLHYTPTSLATPQTNNPFGTIPIAIATILAGLWGASEIFAKRSIG